MLEREKEKMEIRTFMNGDFEKLDGKCAGMHRLQSISFRPHALLDLRLESLFEPLIAGCRQMNIERAATDAICGSVERPSSLNIEKASRKESQKERIEKNGRR